MIDHGERPIRITPDMLLGRRVDFERRMRRLPPVTATLAALLAVIFAVEVAAGALDSEYAIVAAGALDAAAVEAGEYWRLLSATLLHGSAQHLIGNGVALFILGMVCEHAYGRRQFVLLWIGSALSGSVLSLFVTGGPSVGASGAIFGLQAAAIVLFRRYGDHLLVRDRRIGVVLIAWAVYSIATGLTSPFIDNGAHIGGAIGGALIARHLHPVVLSPMPPAHAVWVRRWLWVAGAIVVYTFAGWLA